MTYEQMVEIDTIIGMFDRWATLDSVATSHQNLTCAAQTIARRAEVAWGALRDKLQASSNFAILRAAAARPDIWQAIRA